jgi:multidrug efflux pump subunit AcrA (membrane-fusion protein)
VNTQYKLLFLVVAASALATAACKSKEVPAAAAESKAGKKEDEAIKLSAEQMKSSGIQVSKALKRALSVEVELSGEIASDTDRVVQLRPESPGTLEQLLVAVGDNVEPGQVLVRYRSEVSAPQSAEIKAAQSGVVVGIYAEPGAHIDSAVPLVTIADSSRLRCGLDVYEKDIARVRKNQKVKIKVGAFPNETFWGTVSYISPRVDENSRTIKIRVDIANTGGKLKFGMFVKGFLEVGERDALAVPETAVQNVKGKTFVFEAEEPGSFVPREVRMGERSGGWAEILSGLREGASVVGKGSFILKSEVLKGEMGEGD